MSVDSKGVCITPNKDILSVAKIIGNAVDDLVKANKSKTVRFDKDNTFIKWELVPICDMIVGEFTIKGEKRRLHVHFGCDSDYQQEGFLGSKIIFSLGCWGENEEIFNVVSDALSSLGPVFTKMNDCSDDPFELRCEPQFMKG